MNNNKLQQKLVKLAPAKYLLNDPILNCRTSQSLNQICLDMVKGINFQGFQNVQTSIKKLRKNNSSDYDFFNAILEIIKEIAEIKHEEVLLAIVNATQNVLNQGSTHSTKSDKSVSKSSTTERQIYERPNLDNLNHNKNKHLWENNETIDLQDLVDTKTMKEDLKQETPLEEENNYVSNDDIKPTDKENENWDEEPDWDTPEEENWSQFAGEDLKILNENVEAHKAKYIEIDDIIDPLVKKLSPTKLKLTILPQNTNPNYQVFLVDSFTPNEDLDKIMNYLDNVKEFGLDTEFTREKGAVFIQVSTFEYGFIFNLNECENEVREMLKQEGTDIGENERPNIFRYNETFKRRFRNIMGNSEIAKVGFSLNSDKDMIERFYLSELIPHEDFKNFISIEDVLYSARSSNNCGLSTMTKRIYGKQLDKDLQQFIAESTSLGYEEVQYAILDALIPIVLYKIYFGKMNLSEALVHTDVNAKRQFKMPKLSELNLGPEQYSLDKLSLQGQSVSLNFSQIINTRKKFFIDRMCVQVGDELCKLGYNCEFIDSTYDDIIKNIEEKSKKEIVVLITADKYLIHNSGAAYWVLFTGKKNTMRTLKDLGIH